MEVLVGPNFGIDVRDRSGVVPSAADQHAVASYLLLEEDISGTPNGPGSVFGIGSRGKELNEESSESSSSIGAPDDSEDEDNDDVSSKEVRSNFSGTGLRSLGSLEETLPIKRGLSNHFTGKSKSFANLSEVSAVKDLEKPENPFNKRRRVLVAAKWSRSSFYSSSNPKSMPLLALNEEEDEDEYHQYPSSPPSLSAEKKEQEEHHREHQERVPRTFIDRRLLSFKSRSCISLSDLQEHDEHDDD